MVQERNSHNNEKSGWLKDPGNALLITYILAIIFLLIFCGLEQVQAQEQDKMDGTVSMAEVQRGELLMPTPENGRFVPAPLLSQDVHISISGIVARAVVKQQFVNRSQEWVEALYVFPLPDESAVDHLRMKIGERVIVGEIKEKQKARAVYEKAKREGRKSSLLVSNRANIFTTSVANIGPGETVEIEIEYQQIIHYADTIFSFRFPMVVGPRYIPGRPLQTNNQAEQSFSGSGWSMNTDQVPDASEITPPVVGPEEKPIHPVSLSIELAAGFPLSRIDSLYHGVDIKEKEKNIYFISFNQKVFADRDFVLEYQPEESHSPQGALFAEKKSEENYMLLMLMPPTEQMSEKRIPREMIFVVDTSGSMAGPSLRQAKKAMILAISRLQPDDYFNVIEFNSHTRSLFSEVRSGDSHNVQQATRFVEDLRSEGGTEMRPALELALDGKNNHERIRQVVFLTDGAVGNETALFKLIAGRLGDSRLFTVGIGSAPNSFFMTRAATMGRGTFTFIGKTQEVADKMGLLFNKLERPVITSIELKVAGSDGKTMEVYPSPLPDLYMGEPLIAAIRIEHGMDTLQLSGTSGGRPWSQGLNIKENGKRPGVAVLWARKKIRNLMESHFLGADKEEVREQVLATALDHHLVSKYTSLVAVEQNVSRPADKRLNKAPLKTNMPAGWQHGKVFGGTARTATPSMLLLISGLLLCSAAAILLRRKQMVGP